MPQQWEQQIQRALYLSKEMHTKSESRCRRVPFGTRVFKLQYKACKYLAKVSYLFQGMTMHRMSMGL